jgi:creatinine amidohydrolase
MPGSILSLAELSWVELDSLDKDLTIVLLPLSPIEEHGPHLPIGTDIFGAQDIAALAAQNVLRENPEALVVVAPVIPLGCAPITADFPGTISLRGETFFNLMIDVCSGLARSGFKYIAIVNHHLDSVHLKAILEAIDTVSSRYPVHIIETAGRILYSGMEIAEIAKGAELGLAMRTEVHADVRETSYIRHSYPHLLKLDPSTLAPVLIDIREGLAQGFNTFREMGATQGYIGTPAAATDEIGRIHLEEQGHITADLILRLMSGRQLPEIRPGILRYLRENVELT